MNIEHSTAHDLMTRKLVTGTRDESLRVAASRMNRHGVHCLLVLNDAGSPGIITAKDIVQLLGDADERVLDELCISDAMTCPVFGLQAHQPVRDCVNLMRMAGVRRMPVFEGAQLVGMLSSTDILRAIAERAEPIAA